MKNKKINNRSNWPVLDATVEALARGEAFPTGAFAAIADRLRSAIESPDAQRIEDASKRLEHFLRTTIAGASSDVQLVSRGENGSVSGADAAILYSLGKVAFAQLLAARIADTRVDERFVERVFDKRYLPILHELAAEPLSVTQLKERTGEALATVSRKLGVLRGLGIVAFRKQGNIVMNLLTPAAKEVLATHAHLAGSKEGTGEDSGATTTGTDTAAGYEPPVPDDEARHKLEDIRAALDEHMQSPPQFRGSHLRLVG